MVNIQVHRRKRYALLTMLLAATSALYALGPESLFAPHSLGDGQTKDWRIINKAESAKNPWTAVGNFLIPGLGGYCSAVLVAPRIVLTANHCLYAMDHRLPTRDSVPRKQLMAGNRFAFFAGVHDDEFVDMIQVKEVITGGWYPGSKDASKDWLIAILERPASNDIRPIPLRPYVLDDITSAWRNKLIVAAYPGGTFAQNTLLRFSFNCSMVQSESNRLLTTTCGTRSGSSGGPILLEEGGKLRLVGIHGSQRSRQSTNGNSASINVFLDTLNAQIARFASPARKPAPPVSPPPVDKVLSGPGLTTHH